MVRGARSRCFVQTVLSFALALLATGCGDEDAKPESDEAGCEGRGEPIELGLRRERAGRALSAALAAAAPLPPETGDNAWTFELSVADGEPLSGAVVVAHTLMVDHQHTSPAQLAVETEPGRYELSPIVITMPGFWTLT